MAHVRKGLLTTPREWHKHLRKFWKRLYWSRERKAVQREVQRQHDRER